MSHQPTHRLASSYEKRYTRAFLNSVEIMKGRVTDEVVADVMARGLTDKPEALYELVDQMVLAKTAEEDVFAELIVEAGRMELRLLGFGSLAGQFNLTSPFVLEAARKFAADLVTNVSAETKKAIKQIIFESIRDGIPPAEAARTIREIVGLTRGHAIAVKRFAETHTAKATARYSRKLLNLRARSIARTETINASIVGQQEAWKQMARDGLLDTSRFWQKWVVTRDDRLCERCAPMDGKLIRLDGRFLETERGLLPSERVAVAGETVNGPPLHVNCRCALVGVFDE